jgi:hypothetical protein
MQNRSGLIRALGGLFGGQYGNADIGSQFINMFGHPQHGVAAASVSASVAAIESNPAAASTIVGELLQKPGVVDIPGVVAALEAIVAASNPFNAVAFNAAVLQLEAALQAVTPAPAADTVGVGWHGWGTRLGEHLRNVRTGPGHATHRK